MLLLEGFHVFYCSLADYDFETEFNNFRNKYKIQIQVNNHSKSLFFIPVLDLYICVQRSWFENDS